MNKITKSLEETKELAREFVRTAGEKKTGNGALVVGLYGDLGAGKTSFSQGVAAALGVSENVTSPTFVIMKAYQLKDNPDFDRFIHIDAYRLQGGAELHHIGFEEIIADPKNLVLVEWAERVDDSFPEGSCKIEFHHKGGDMREIKWE